MKGKRRTYHIHRKSRPIRLSDYELLLCLTYWLRAAENHPAVAGKSEDELKLILKRMRDARGHDR